MSPQIVFGHAPQWRDALWRSAHNCRPDFATLDLRTLDLERLEAVIPLTFEVRRIIKEQLLEGRKINAILVEQHIEFLRRQA